MSKALDISSATVRVPLDLLKDRAILSDIPVRRYAADPEDLKPYWKSEKRSPFSRWSTIIFLGDPMIYKFFKDFTNHRKKSNRP